MSNICIKYLYYGVTNYLSLLQSYYWLISFTGCSCFEMFAPRQCWLDFNSTLTRSNYFETAVCVSCYRPGKIRFIIVYVTILESLLTFDNNIPHKFLCSFHKFYEDDPLNIAKNDCNIPLSSLLQLSISQWYYISSSFTPLNPSWVKDHSRDHCFISTYQLQNFSRSCTVKLQQQLTVNCKLLFLDSKHHPQSTISRCLPLVSEE